jgi:hypothetical protein
MDEEFKAPERSIPEAAQRALKEAAERRAAAHPTEIAKEVGGRKGPEPVRYGDWELNGIAQDF